LGRERRRPGFMRWVNRSRQVSMCRIGPPSRQNASAPRRPEWTTGSGCIRGESCRRSWIGSSRASIAISRHDRVAAILPAPPGGLERTIDEAIDGTLELRQGRTLGEDGWRPPDRDCGRRRGGWGRAEPGTRWWPPWSNGPSVRRSGTAHPPHGGEPVDRFWTVGGRERTRNPAAQHGRVRFCTMCVPKCTPAPELPRPRAFLDRRGSSTRTSSATAAGST
jgi:hypothetical protein